MNGYTEKRSNRCEDGSNEQKKKSEEEKTRTGTLQYGYPKPFIGRSGVVSVEKGEKKGGSEVMWILRTLDLVEASLGI